MSARAQQFTAVPIAVPNRSRKRLPKPCPCCGQAGGLCDPHKERLGKVRDSLFSGGGRYGQRSDQRKVKLGSTCCQPHCWNARMPPAAFCPECQQAGYVEED